MPIQPTTVSVTVPVGQAIERVKLILFRPFDLSKWFVIGFSAWLAHLGETGFNFNYNIGSRRRGRGVGPELERIRDYVMNNLSWIVPLAVLLVILCIALWVAVTWVSSRGRLMFLHCVAHNTAEIGAPWRNFGREGNSLFVFRIVLGLIGMVPMLPLLVVGIVATMKMFRRGGPDVAGIAVLVGVALMIVAVGIVLFVVAKLTTDFVLPIMLLRRNTCVAAWRELLGLISANVGQFVLYLLFQIVIAMATGALVVAVIIATCCIAGCLMIIPYVGTVVLLPILAFKRCYSLHYLAQYGREYDVFPLAATV